jgi:predicted amidohydrolase
MPIAAVVQLNGSSNVDRNLRIMEQLVRSAAAEGAVVIATPEATTYLGPHREKVRLAEAIDGPTHRRLGALAAELKITLLIGSVAERCDDVRAYNTTLVFGPDGARQAHYRKMHLFDVDLAAQGGVCFRESDRTAAGKELVVTDSPIGPIGLSICFDLRFPEVYRGLVDRGAHVLAVPSAFTAMTGKDHWHILLRCRAIETQSWVLAPAQWGPHDDEGLRRSFGHSLIVDPWGRIVAEVSEGEGFALADIDVNAVAKIRGQIPMTKNRVL